MTISTCNPMWHATNDPPYNLTCPVKVTATTVHAASTLTIQGAALASGAQTPAFSVAQGGTLDVAILVTAQVYFHIHPQSSSNVSISSQRVMPSYV